MIVTIYTVSIYELVRRYQFFKEGKSPLFYCYIFVVLGGTGMWDIREKREEEGGIKVHMTYCSLSLDCRWNGRVVYEAFTSIL